jgi:hypothetical protein
MKSVSSNLAKLNSNVEWAVLPLSDRTGWTRVRFGDVVENCAETCDPQGAELEQFITLSRGVCPRFLVIARSTIDSSAPKGQKEMKKLGDCPGVFSRLIHLANALFHDESHFNDLRPERIPLSKLAHAPIDSS